MPLCGGGYRFHVLNQDRCVVQPNAHQQIVALFIAVVELFVAVRRLDHQSCFVLACPSYLKSFYVSEKK